ncbi:hypothetical protein BV900_17055 [Agrobacterium tumefaciens]|nr:hypothetical protein BV900_17055 [Agrobacterium tumefaciens]
MIELVGAANIAAFVLEPVIGASGSAIVPHSSYLQQVRDICNHKDILLIFDEVITVNKFASTVVYLEALPNTGNGH